MYEMLAWVDLSRPFFCMLNAKEKKKFSFFFQNVLTFFEDKKTVIAVNNGISLLSQEWQNCWVLRVPSGSWASLWEEKLSRHQHSEQRKPLDCRRQSDLWSDRCPLQCPGLRTPADTCGAEARRTIFLQSFCSSGAPRQKNYHLFTKHLIIFQLSQ